MKFFEEKWEYFQLNFANFFKGSEKVGEFG